MGIHPGNSTACAGRQAVQFHGCNPGWFNRFLLGPLENPEKNRLMEKSLQLFPIFGPIRAAFLWKSGEVFGGNFHDFTQQVKHIHKLTHGNSFLSGVTKNTGFKRFVGVDFLWNLCLQKKTTRMAPVFSFSPKISLRNMAPTRMAPIHLRLVRMGLIPLSSHGVGDIPPDEGMSLSKECCQSECPWLCID